MTLGRSTGAVASAALLACALALGGCTTDPAVIDGHGAASRQAIEPDTVALTPHETVPLSDSLRLPDASSVAAGPVSPDPVAPPTADQDRLLASATPLPAVEAEELFGGATEPNGGLVGTWANQVAIDKQMAYMFAHWNNYNVAGYGNYNSSGGDCMNFVSQSLVERGWAMQPDWHNLVDPSNGFRYATASFIHVPSFDAWLTAHPTYATRVEFDQQGLVKIGDVIIFDWDPAAGNRTDHAMVVSDIRIIDGERRLFLIGHNNDSNYRDLNAVMAADTDAIAHFWSIP